MNNTNNTNVDNTNVDSIIYTSFNPICKGKHDYTSHDQMNCENCVTYGNAKRSQWLKEKEAQNVSNEDKTLNK